MKKPLKPCNKYGCNQLTRDKYCESHRQLPEQRKSSNQRGYNYKWQLARERFLKQNPLFVHCKNEGKYISATVVDHIIPHKGDMKLFWDSKNCQPLCKHPHDVKTATEDGGFGKGSIR
ncbi:HNH endonuclease [Gottfriedia sp. OAE603]|uniref:HNH endonuclease n=1 Tax=Gottfriedia sp. OAE603 TaxID=2663872 RepID=UPI00178B364F